MTAKKKVNIRVLKGKTKPKPPEMEPIVQHWMHNNQPKAFQYGFNSYEETTLLIKNLANKINFEADIKRIEQPRSIITMAERIIYFANDLTRDFNKE